jgi:hypothetical protein
MNKIAFFLLASLLIPSLVVAEETCGVLDFGTDVVWEYKDGAFFDIDGGKMSSVIPDKKKLQIRSDSGLASIEKVGSSKNIKFGIKPLKKGKIIQVVKRAPDSIALFEGSGADLNFLLINLESGEVSRASVAAAGASKKISFVLDEEAYFFLDSCSRDDEEEEEPIEE